MGNVCTNDSKSDAIEKVAMDSEASVKEPVEEKSSEPKLTITIVGARGLRDADWLPGAGKSDCYCEVKTGDLVLHKTKVVNDTCDPCWAETLELTDIADFAPLVFNVYDKDVGKPDDLLGKATLEGKKYSEEGFNGELKIDDPKAPQAFIKIKVKLAGKPLPEGPKPEVTVTIEKEAQKSFGLDLDTQDSTALYILEVKDGPFLEYNATAAPEVQVKPNDVIVSVNGVSGSTEEMLKQFRQELKVECKIRRSILCSVIFDRGDANSALGIQFPEKPQGDLLLVRGFEEEGAAPAHNRNAKDNNKLYTSDRIISVGKTKDKAPELLEQLTKASGPVQLMVLRPAVLPPTGATGLAGMVHWLFN